MSCKNSCEMVRKSRPQNTSTNSDILLNLCFVNEFFLEFIKHNRIYFNAVVDPGFLREGARLISSKFLKLKKKILFPPTNVSVQYIP